MTGLKIEVSAIFVNGIAFPDNSMLSVQIPTKTELDSILNEASKEEYSECEEQDNTNGDAPLTLPTSNYREQSINNPKGPEKAPTQPASPNRPIKRTKQRKEPTQMIDEKFDFMSSKPLQRLETCLGLRLRPANWRGFRSLKDVVFAAIDLSLNPDSWARARDSNGEEKPTIRGFTVATLDTRDLDDEETAWKDLVLVQRFSMENAEEGMRVGSIAQMKIALRRCLNIKDEECLGTPRKVILVGHSPQRTLQVLRRLGIHICDEIPLEGIFDTLFLTRKLLGPDTAFLKSKPLRQHFSLEAVLEELGVAREDEKAIGMLKAVVKIGIGASEKRLSWLTGTEKRKLRELKSLME